MENGALVFQAHPYREASYIDHIRLFPGCVNGVEVINACRTDFENQMADAYAEAYGLLKLAGSDNHNGCHRKSLAGVATDTPICDEKDFCRRLIDGDYRLFAEANPLVES